VRARCNACSEADPLRHAVTRSKLRSSDHIYSGGEGEREGEIDTTRSDPSRRENRERRRPISVRRRGEDATRARARRSHRAGEARGRKNPVPEFRVPELTSPVIYAPSSNGCSPLSSTA